MRPWMIKRLERERRKLERQRRKRNAEQIGLKVPGPAEGPLDHNPRSQSLHEPGWATLRGVWITDL